MSDPIRTVIADDEPLARRQLRSLLERDPQISLVAEAGTGFDARRAIKDLKPELVLLDVRMPHGDGFTAIENLQDPPYVIFATAHSEHAVRAFDLEAVDYLLKPFDDERFERAIRRAKEVIRARRLVDLARDIGTTGPNATLPGSEENERITVHEGRQIIWVNVAEVEWIEAADYYAQVHARGRVHVVREPLQSFEDRFGKKFLRVHRGALVSVAHIQRLDRLEGGDLVVVMQSGVRVTVSRSRRAGVLRDLGVR
jgi:two-component system LytT family response regulator